ncbi:MAG: CocE/NonD family hydrolase [Firmicutes bacterium]|nr:CocE/NonD family hydrolase [Bacillota bacterium]
MRTETGFRMKYNLKAPMRDGVAISTDLYLPDAHGPFPVILIRTPYSNNAEPRVRMAMDFARRGYAVAIQDCRGRWDSQGEWYPFKHEISDTCDAVEWCGTQPWSNGKVGMTGASYEAAALLYAATGRPRHLVCLAPRVGYSNYFHNWAYTGGAFQLGFNYRWLGMQMHAHTNQALYPWLPEENRLESLWWTLPLVDMAEAAGRENPIWREWLAHSRYDDYWRGLSPVDEGYHRVEVPIYGFGGWYDIFCQGTLNNYMGVKAGGATPQARASQKVLIGPWIHNLGDQGRIAKTGDVDFGPEAHLDLIQEYLRWFDFWLQGIDNGIMQEPPVKVFVMGDGRGAGIGTGRWREAPDWPIPGTVDTPYYLHSRGNANTSFGDGALSKETPAAESPDHFTYDPHNPVPTVGGSTCCSEDQTPISMGPRDQRWVELRPDVLVYTSGILEEDLEVIGSVKLVLYASSSAPDTDFTAKLVDVSPNGFCMNVAQGILRARFRESWEEPSLIRPEDVYRYELDLWSTAVRFRKGHRIRVDLTSSNFPQFDRNPNTGRPFGQDSVLAVAHQEVHHDRVHPSHILLPVITRE